MCYLSLKSIYSCSSKQFCTGRSLWTCIALVLDFARKAMMAPIVSQGLLTWWDFTYKLSLLHIWSGLNFRLCLYPSRVFFTVESFLLRNVLWMNFQVIWYLRWIPKVLEGVRQVSSLSLGWTSRVRQQHCLWSLCWTFSLVAATVCCTLGDMAHANRCPHSGAL